MDFNKFFQSKSFKIIIWVIIGLAVFCFIFNIGMFIGFRKASFSYKWGENYHRNFAGPRQGFLRDFGRDFGGQDFIESHGVIGQIIKIEDSELVIKGPNDVEKVVLVKDKTVINRFRETIKVSDLKVDDQIVVIGEPNEAGQIEAKLIRLLPPPPPMPSFGPPPWH